MDQDFEQELKEIFKSEADDYLTVLNEGLAKLKEGPDDQVLEEMFRTTHSLKGAARAVNFSGVEELCQVVESLFSKLKNHEMNLTDPLIEVLTSAIDHLSDLIQQGNFEADADVGIMEQIQQALKSEGTDKKSEKQDKKETTKFELTSKVKKSKKQTPTEPPTVKAAEKVPEQNGTKQETIRISYDRIRNLFNQSEELITIKIKQKYYLDRLKELSGQMEVLNQKYKKHPTFFNSEAKLNLAEVRSEIESLKKQIDNLQKSLTNDKFQISNLLDKHLNDLRQLMMFPFSTITNYIERSTRTIARELNKKINLKIHGAQIEMDKHVLELLKDPLIHLIRNSLDHGIEPPEERKSKGKGETGNIVIEVLPPRDQKIVIKISDDGRGIDLSKIKQKALEKHLYTREELESMSQAQLLSIIFHSGFSTQEQVSKLSGRGLGMAVVKENLEKLGGSLGVENYFPNGCTFLLTIPLSLATSRGILITAGRLKAIIPTEYVKLPLRISTDSLKTVKNQYMLNHNEQNIPLFPLTSLLSMSTEQEELPPQINVLVLKLKNDQIAVTVDQVIDEREILLKNLNSPLENVRFLSGMTFLGDGSLVPVLNVQDIFKAAAALKSASLQKKSKKKKQILVVEDSITSRVLLKNVLESAGFKVTTAINGRQAWEILQQQKFDLIVSDVQMPEMDGIQLTRNVKKDAQLKDTPLILLTSLGSENDKKMGLEAGANAYFVKSDFRQKSILHLINQLI